MEYLKLSEFDFEKKDRYAYFAGKIAGLEQAAGKYCKECLDGWDVEFEKERKEFLHGQDKIRCSSQRIQYLIRYCHKQLDEAYLNGRYGGMWHTSYKLTKEFGYFDKCFSCNERPTKRIDANIWGCVREYDMCYEHAERYDGKCLDDVEFRKEKAS